jgi:hypothetical protein
MELIDLIITIFLGILFFLFCFAVGGIIVLQFQPPQPCSTYANTRVDHVPARCFKELTQ